MQHPEPDPVTRIYTHAEALRSIANLLPEHCAGLALVLTLLGNDLAHCGEALDSNYPAKPGQPQ